MKWLNHFFSLESDLEDFSSIRSEIEQTVHFRGSNLLILIIAIIVASLGLNVNSTPVIIGAMLISPLMGPIMGIGLGAVINDFPLLKRAAKNYSFATIAGLLASTIYFAISPIDEAHSELLARTSPNIYDLLIALFGGAAGIIALSTRNKGNVLAGVAIATALMPPLCTAGYGLATGQMNFLVGALYLYLVNSVYIALATFMFGKYYQFPQANTGDTKKQFRSTRIILFLTLITLVPSLYLGYSMVLKSRFLNKANRFIQNELSNREIFIIKKQIDADKREIQLNYIGEILDSNSIALLDNKLTQYDLHNTKLRITRKFEYGNSNISNTIKEQNNINIMQMIELNRRLDSLMAIESTYQTIEKEMLILFPEIESVYFKTSTQLTPSVLVKCATQLKINSIDTSKISEWIRYRLDKDSIALTFVQ